MHRIIRTAKYVLVAIFFSISLSGCTTSSDYYSEEAYDDPELEDSKIISKDEAIAEYWEEIKDNISGTETIEACSFESGNCYDLDADISNGSIESIYFSNGGNLDFYLADLDNSGNSSDTDYDSNSWDFSIDMSSSIIQDAVEEWADDEGYVLE